MNWFQIGYQDAAMAFASSTVMPEPTIDESIGREEDRKEYIAGWNDFVSELQKRPEPSQ